MAGLLAARVLSDRFERVRIIERDALPKGPEPRRGVPQSKHLHVFMMRGRRIAEGFFPGIEEELLVADAQLIDIAQDARWLTPAGFGPHFRSGLPFLMCSRDLLEWTVRKRVAALGNVRFLEQTAVTGLLPTGDEEGVAGVKVSFRGPCDGEAGGEEKIGASLVVDASGRGSHASRWLEDLGYEPPEETLVGARLGYATRLYERTDEPARSWKALYVQAAPPDVTRGGGLFPLENGRWICTLYGLGGDYPPTDEEGFLSFARSLRTPLMYDAIKDLKPVTEITGNRTSQNRRRHYERLSRQPHNFLVTGDAACAFNPVYGQGLTTAALGAEALEKCLREGCDGDLSGRFQKRLAKVNAGPWLLATGEDFRVRGVEGGKPGLSTRLTHRYMDRVLALSMRDVEVRRTFLEVFAMMKPPTALFGPGIVAKVLRGAVARNGKVEGPAVGSPAHETV